jgi:hypothetical protein
MVAVYEKTAWKTGLHEIPRQGVIRFFLGAFACHINPNHKMR